MPLESDRDENVGLRTEPCCDSTGSDRVEPVGRERFLSEAMAMAAPGKANDSSTMEFDKNNFDKIGPKAAEVLKDAGVESLKIEKTADGDRYTFKFKNPLEIPQNPDTDGCKKLIIGQELKATVSKDPDGTIKVKNIEGLSAEADAFFRTHKAKVHDLEMRLNDKGETEITSHATAKVGGLNIERDNVKVKPKEIKEKADLLFDRIEKLKSSSPAKTSGIYELPTLLFS